MAYYIVSLNDPVAGGTFIYKCMKESNNQSPQEIAATQSMFMQVTRLMGEIDPAYSLQCSREYLNLVKDEYGTSKELEELLKQGNQGEGYE